MVTTLEDYRRELGKHISLTLLMGSDTLATLPRWYQWEKILELANIVVINRPGYIDFPEKIDIMLRLNRTDNKEDLKNKAHGQIYCFNAGLFHDASSDLREQMKIHPVDTLSLPETVKTYIKTHQLYL
jgi:nicotinate-nucleotide adenylyltransferase